MTTTTAIRQTAAALIGAATLLGSAAACSSSTPSEEGGDPAPSARVIPPEIQAVCGKPGKRVRVKVVPVTIPRAECDLSGVVVVYRGAGAQVPSKPGAVSGFADGVDEAHSGSISVTVTKKDVTIDGGI